MAQQSTSYLPYEEPSVKTILFQSTFLILLNVVNFVFDRLIFCGLIGQILLGVAWGTPGAQWLSENAQTVIGQLGYLGLILIVYEGALSTSLPVLRANLLLSSCVALTGIVIPITLSFALMPLVSATKLQAFAAGAALCSTSLGTTFTVLGTSGLVTSRLGVVLTSAAMLDDVVGLIMVQVISNLGKGEIRPLTVLRPIIVSVALVLVLLLTCRFLISPLVTVANTKLQKMTSVRSSLHAVGQYAKISLHLSLLLGFVVGASFAGTSNLFAAYLAGAVVCWSDHLIKVPDARGSQIYEKHLQVAVDRVLRPFFFGSIGFAIPISDMFTGPVVWKGLIYTILMALAKLVCGTWLLPRPSQLFSLQRILYSSKKTGSQPTTSVDHKTTPRPKAEENVKDSRERHKKNDIELDNLADHEHHEPSSATSVKPQSSPSQPARLPNTKSKRISNPAPKARSLYPASILGSAMIARGEIGFLISSLAESHGIFSSSSSSSQGKPSEIYLIVTWAIMLCTIIGPIVVGLLVRRVQRLQLVERERSDGRVDPLGIWGMIQN